jgi:predicted nucleic acid-binding protein
MIVADTNLVAYFVIPGSSTDSAEKVGARDRDWIAPSLLRSELLSVTARYVSAGLVERDDAVRSFRRGLDLVKMSDLPSDPVGVLNLCAQSGCTGYDAEFIWLANELNLPVVTADAALIRAFPDVAVSFEDFAGGK